MSKDIINLLNFIKTVWSESYLQEAKEASVLLEELLSTNPVEDPWDDVDKVRCPAPIVPQYKGGGESVEKLLQLTRLANDELPWKTPRHLVSGELRPGFSPSYDLAQLLGGEGKFKSAMMVGSARYGATLISDKLLVGFTWLQQGTHYPQHAHHAAEVYQILAGTASWGLTANHLAPVAPGEYLYHLPATPHTIHVPAEDSLLAIYAWTGHISGSFWFCDPGLGRKYVPLLASVHHHEEDADDLEKHFDEFAPDYEAVTRGWGYNMPEIVAHRLELIVGGLIGLRVLDVCCGNGLVGAALDARGVHDLQGLDISGNMVGLARERGIYSSIIQCDANKPLPVASEECDIVVCVGSTKFLQHQVMEEWLRVLKKGGLVAFTHILEIASTWEKLQEEKKNQGQWEMVWISEKLPYLPACGKSHAKVYIYKKL